MHIDLKGAWPGSTMLDGWAALQSGNFELAQTIFEKLADAEDLLPAVWFGLASLSHRRREFLEAADLFDRAAEAQHLRPNAKYNRACALAGEIEPALDAALDAGFKDATNLKGDKELASLHDEPRWKKIVERLDGSSK